MFLTLMFLKRVLKTLNLLQNDSEAEEHLFGFMFPRFVGRQSWMQNCREKRKKSCSTEISEQWSIESYIYA